MNNWAIEEQARTKGVRRRKQNTQRENGGGTYTLHLACEDGRRVSSADTWEILNQANYSFVPEIQFTMQGSTAYAGYFLGNVHVAGTLTKSSGAFLIDHPLDPANKVLRHSFVESPEMMNIYRGRARLRDGVAVVDLPAYFDALNAPENREVSLTCIGGFSPLYVEESVKDNKFTVRTAPGGNPEQEFNWLVTGIRNDPFARANPIIVEQEKGSGTGCKPGEYLNPDAYGVCQRKEGPVPKNANDDSAAASTANPVIPETGICPPSEVTTPTPGGNARHSVAEKLVALGIAQGKASELAPCVQEWERELLLCRKLSAEGGNNSRKIEHMRRMAWPILKRTLSDTEIKAFGLEYPELVPADSAE